MSFRFFAAFVSVCERERQGSCGKNWLLAKTVSPPPMRHVQSRHGGALSVDVTSSKEMLGCHGATASAKWPN